MMVLWHLKYEFSAGDGKHINGIESFWAYAKHRLTKFKGVSPQTFELHLRETEFRFNNRDADFYKLMLKLLRKIRYSCLDPKIFVNR